MKEVTWAILGFGEHAHRVLLPAFLETEGCELSAVGSVRGAWLNELPVRVRTYRNYKDLLSSETSIQAVYVATTNQLHEEVISLALQAGKHVLCEKPLHWRKDATERLLILAKEKNRHLVEAFMYRFHPQHVLARSIVESATLGQLRHFEAQYCYELLDPSNSRLKKECAGGIALDAACYLLDAARHYLGGLPLSMTLTEFEQDVRFEVETTLTIEAKFASEVSAKLHCSSTSNRQNSIRISGTKGTLEIPSAFHMPRGKKALLLQYDAANKLRQHRLPPANQFSLMLSECSRLFSNSSQGTILDSGLETAIMLESLRQLFPQPPAG